MSSKIVCQTKFCLFCGNSLGESASWSNGSYCLYGKPNCVTSYNNFIRSIKKAKESKILINQRIALWAEEKMAEGFPAMQVKKIYDFVRSGKYKPKLIKTQVSNRSRSN